MPPPCRSVRDAQAVCRCDVRHSLRGRRGVTARRACDRSINRTRGRGPCPRPEHRSGAPRCAPRGLPGRSMRGRVGASARRVLVVRHRPGALDARGQRRDRVQGVVVDPGDVDALVHPTPRTTTSMPLPGRSHPSPPPIRCRRTLATSSAPWTSLLSRRPTARGCSGGGSSRAAGWRSRASAPTSPRPRSSRRWARRCGRPAARFRGTGASCPWCARGAARDDPLARAGRACARGAHEVRGQRAGRGSACSGDG